MKVLLKKVGRSWLKFAELIGNFQMTVLLSLVYWVLVPLLAIPMKLLSDPLSIKKDGASQGISRQPDPNPLESMRKQG